MTLRGHPDPAMAWYGWRGIDPSTSSTRRRSSTTGDPADPDATIMTAHPVWQRNPTAHPVMGATLRLLNRSGRRIGCPDTRYCGQHALGVTTGDDLGVDVRYPVGYEHEVPHDGHRSLVPSPDRGLPCGLCRGAEAVRSGSRMRSSPSSG